MTASPLLVLERAVLLHRLLDAADVPHALGGALALAYHVREARATRDIDLNVQVDPQAPSALFALLPEDVPWSSSDVDAVRRDGQVRLLWPHPDGQAPVPLDLFFPQHELHEGIVERSLAVPMLDAVVPVVGATDLAVLKALFDRRKDWADIEELLRAGSVDVDVAVSWLERIVGRDHRVQLLREIEAEVASTE